MFNRLVARAGEIAPERLAELDISEIKACGMSLRKAEYIRKIAEAAVNGTVDFGGLKAKPDREVIDILTTLPGVGIWTAEMLLIFSLARPNVLSFSDFGIRKGLMKLHGIDRLTKEKFDEYRSLYSPYCTTASIYLWEIAKES